MLRLALSRKEDSAMSELAIDDMGCAGLPFTAKTNISMSVRAVNAMSYYGAKSDLRIRINDSHVPHWRHVGDSVSHPGLQPVCSHVLPYVCDCARLQLSSSKRLASQPAVEKHSQHHLIF